MGEQGPLLLCSAVEKRPRMACVADGEAVAGREEGGNDGGGEGSRFGHFRELFVEQTDKLGLIEAVDETTHERAEIGGSGGDGMAVTGDVGEEQTSNAAGGAAGGVVNVTAALGFAIGLAENPSFQAAEFNAAGDRMTAAPDLHAEHLLCCWLAHGFSHR